MRPLIFTALGLAVLAGPLPADEPSAEVKATIKLHGATLKSSKSVADRRKAALALGELGAAGRDARRILCQAMLDSAASVRTAAADALKKIDEPMYKLATAITINSDVNAVHQAERMGSEAEPLTPLVLALAKNSVAKAAASKSGPVCLAAISRVQACVTALTAAAPDDAGVNSFVFACLNYTPPSTDSTVESHAKSTRGIAITCARKCANVKQAARALLAVAAADPAEGNRVAAIELLADIIDVDSRPGIEKALEKMRFDNSAAIRNAVDAALAKIKGK